MDVVDGHKCKQPLPLALRYSLVEGLPSNRWNKRGVNTPDNDTMQAIRQTIHFDNNIVSERTGKKIPLQEGSDDPHTCAEWEAQHRRYYHCRDGNAPIYFDDKHLSKNGSIFR